MNPGIPPGRLVRDLQPSTWTLDGEGWTVAVVDGGSEFSATLYHHSKYSNRIEFAEGRGATKEEALKDLRKLAEAFKTRIENALSFDWKV